MTTGLQQNKELVKVKRWKSQREADESVVTWCVSHGVCGLSVQVTLHGGDELALLLQRQVQVVFLVLRDVLQHLVHQLVVF